MATRAPQLRRSADAVELIEKVAGDGIYFSEGYGLSESTSLGMANPRPGDEEDREHRHPLPGQRRASRGRRDRHHGRQAREPGEIIMKGRSS